MSLVDPKSSHTPEPVPKVAFVEEKAERVQHTNRVSVFRLLAAERELRYTGDISFEDVEHAKQFVVTCVPPKVTLLFTIKRMKHSTLNPFTTYRMSLDMPGTSNAIVMTAKRLKPSYFRISMSDTNFETNSKFFLGKLRKGPSGANYVLEGQKICKGFDDRFELMSVAFQRYGWSPRKEKKQGAQMLVLVPTAIPELRVASLNERFQVATSRMTTQERRAELMQQVRILRTPCDERFDPATQEYLPKFTARVTRESTKNFGLVPDYETCRETVQQLLHTSSTSPTASSSVANPLPTALSSPPPPSDHDTFASKTLPIVESKVAWGADSSSNSVGTTLEELGYCCQFGRTGDTDFVLDVQWPLSPLQAFGLALAGMDVSHPL